MDDSLLIDRHDLQALKDWIGAKFEAVDARLSGMQRAVDTAETERTKKDAELNDVRHRFIPREVFDAYKEEQIRSIRAYQIEQDRRRRAFLISFATLALGYVGLVVTVVIALVG